MSGSGVSDTASSPSSVACLQIRHLTAGYRDMRVVHDVSLEVAKGTLSAVVGPNGAGKSTLLKGILGLARLFEGEIMLNGAPVTGKPLDRLAKAGIAYVPQVDDIFDTLRVQENLEMGGYLFDKHVRRERIDEALEIFPKLRKHMRQHGSSLSGGERKMVALARALMLQPSVMILDEPTAGLSPALTETVLRDQARFLADRGKAILIVEQKARAALELADWAYVMVQGRVAISAPGSVVLSDPNMAEVFLGGGSVEQADSSPVRGQQEQSDGGRVSLQSEVAAADSRPEGR